MIDPRRPLSQQSVEVHGITRELLVGQPTIDTVLPQFQTCLLYTSVLLTGTHANTARVVNSLYRQKSGLVRRDAWDRLPGTYHGSGCTLASAIAAGLARGLSVDEAAWEAQDYTWRSLVAGFRPGMGQCIPDRFHQFRPRSGALND